MHFIINKTFFNDSRFYLDCVSETKGEKQNRQELGGGKEKEMRVKAQQGDGKGETKKLKKKKNMNDKECN